MEEIYSKKPALKRKIVEFIESKGSVSKTCMFYKESAFAPKYKITLEIVDEDFIIDDQGRKWIKCEE